MRYDFDVVVIGGGAAGLVAATAAASLGAKTALIENKRLGGDCTWYGCIPSKALLKSAHNFWLLKRIKEFGISANLNYSPENVMAHVRDIVRQVSTHHPPEVFEKRGIKVAFGNAKFLDKHAIELDGRRILSKRFIISTGSHPLIPSIAGLNDIAYLTNENLFDLDVLPESMVVLGGGPIGIEISQAFSRLGVKVTIVEALSRILSREDKEAADILAGRLIKEGVMVCAGNKAVRFTKEGGMVSVTVEGGSKKESILRAEKVLVAVGRAANVGGLDLEKAQVRYSDRGIEVGSLLRTSAKNIYACGDVIGPYNFSHMAEYQAIIAVSNALFPFKQRVNYDAVPWAIFTDPELAHLGLTEEEARAKYKGIKVYRSAYSANDRAVTDLEETGLAKVICDKRGRILGAHIVGAGAGELIHEYVLAKSAGLNIGKLSLAMHVYPTLAQVVKRSADQYYLGMLSAWWVKKMSKFFVGLLR